VLLRVLIRVLIRVLPLRILIRVLIRVPPLTCKGRGSIVLYENGQESPYRYSDSFTNRVRMDRRGPRESVV
jgi:hypothetical protein